MSFVQTYKHIIAGVLITLFLVVACVASLPQAWADEVSDTEAAVADANQKLSEANQQLDSISSDYNSLKAQAASLDDQIQEATQDAVAAQQAMIEGQQKLAATVLSNYKSQTSIVNVLLSSTSLSEFFNNMRYFTYIQDDQSAAIAKQKELSETYEATLDTLNEKKDAQSVLLQQAEAKYAEAQNLVNSASSNLDSAEAAALAAKAQAMKENETAPASQQISEDWNTNTEGGSAAATPTESDTSSSGSSSSDSSSSSSADTGSWSTGVASAYGGSSDSSTPNPGTTATGAVCDDSSMGVAIPMSWSNYRSYFGRSVEISYGGRTVIATVNDCGYMGGGSRDLDLQPGVFKALGYSTCQDWGVRTVSYRFL